MTLVVIVGTVIVIGIPLWWIADSIWRGEWPFNRWPWQW